MRATTVRVSIDHGSTSTTMVTAVAATQPATYAAWCVERQARGAAEGQQGDQAGRDHEQLKVPPATRSRG